MHPEDEFFGGKIENDRRFKNTIQTASRVGPTDIPPIVYDNLISLDYITTAIVSNKENENARRFWHAIEMKKRGFSSS